MVIIMTTEFDVINLCKALHYTEVAEGNTICKWDSINVRWKDMVSDRRYKAYYSCATDNGSGIWYIGDPDRNGRRVLVERFGYENIWFARFASEVDMYQKRPCYKVEFFDDGDIVSEWQDEVLI